MRSECMCSESMDPVDRKFNVKMRCGDDLIWKKRRYSVPLHPMTTAVIRSNYMEKHSSSNGLNTSV